VGHFAGVVNALARAGIRVDVFAPEAPPMVDASVRTHVMPAAAVPAYPYELNYYRYHRRVVRDALPVLAGLGPDALYHRLSLGCWAGASLARRLKIPLIVEYNGSEVWVSRNWGRRLRFEKLAEMGESIGLRAAEIVTVVSEPLADEVHARGVPRDRIVVHPNGVDTTLFDPARFSEADRDRIRRETGIPCEALLCTFVGTFGRWHGVEVLASAIRTLAADAAWVEHHHAHFLLIGDGAMMPLARRELGALTSLVTFAGLRPQHETPAWLAASDILLSPHVPNPDGSRFFGSPTKLFEYMAMARPIVASALEQIADVLQPAYRASDLPIGPSQEAPGARVAVVTTPGSAEEFVAAVRFLADRPDVRAVLGTNARRLALDRYTWDANVEALLAQCERLSGRQDAQRT
jgi:glycosyltransferase involved in cell wall biosynthesis